MSNNLTPEASHVGRQRLLVIEAIVQATADPSSPTYTQTRFVPRENGFMVMMNLPKAKMIYDVVGNLGLDDGLLIINSHELEFEEPS